MIDLLSSPEPLTPRERLALWIATILTALTRVWGLARSPWDWDEILFSLAMRKYDVALHHPHPPGFPMFIAEAKFFRLFGLSDFRSLQAVNLAAGIVLVPAMVFLGRELRLRFSTSLIAALFLAFFPNVWFFGETAFSDVPAVVLVVVACGLLIRGCRSDASFIGGAVVLACAGAMRPQNLAIGFAPMLIAAWYRFRARRLAAILLGAVALIVIVGASFGIAAFETGGWQRYSEALEVHQKYITETDSFRNPNRPPLHHLLDDFFVRPYHAPLINFAITAFALISLGVSLVRRRWPILIVVAAFAPFCLAAWLILDHFSASRFSIGYAPLIAILAADGVDLVSVRRQWIAWTVGVGVTILMFAWTWPAINLARREVSPPMKAIDWIRAHADPKTSLVYAHESMGPYTEYFLADYRVQWTLDGPAVARLDSSPALYLREGVSNASGAMNFSWPRDRAWNVARRRYFEASIVPLRGQAHFGEGWYDAENGGWRWMMAHGTVDLPPIAGKSRLRLRIFIPLHVIKPAPDVIVRVNGSIIAAVKPTAPTFEIVQDFPANSGARTIDIETDRIINPQRAGLSGDTRDLGLRLEALEWIALEP